MNKNNILILHSMKSRFASLFVLIIIILMDNYAGIL